MTTTTLSTGARYLKRGDTFDPEDHRMTYRLGVALSLLASQGIEPEWQHSDHTGLVGTGLMQREAHTCDYRCKAVWPEWVTDELFNQAFALANTIQSERGAQHQREINRAQAARREAQRLDDDQRCADEGDEQRDYAEERYNAATMNEDLPVDRPHRFQVGDEFTLDGVEDIYRIDALTWRERDGVLYPTYTTSGEAPYEAGRETCEDVLDTDDLQPTKVREETKS